MSVFDLDPLASENAIEHARLNPAPADAFNASWYEGVGTGILSGLQSVPARQLLDVASARQTDEQRADYDASIKRLKELTPDPVTVGVVGRTLYNITEMLGNAAVNVASGDVSPTVLAADMTRQYGDTQKAVHIAEGMDAATAEKLGRIEGIGAGAGMVMPASLTGNLLMRTVSGAGIMGAFGAASRGMSGKVLEDAGYHDMAQQYRVFDGTAMATDLVLGAFFGGAFGHRPAARVLPSDLDAALSANNAAHIELDTAPGVPGDMETRQAHVDTVNAHLEAMLRGDDPPPPPDAVVNGNFVDNPAADAGRAEIGAAVEQHLGDLSALQQELEARGLPTDMDFYSRGERAGDTVENVTQAAREAFGADSGRLVDSGAVQVVERSSDLPARPDGEPHPADARGYFDGERVYLVAENLPKGDVKGTILHEVGAHVGMEQMLGPELHAKLLDEVAQRAEAGEAGFAEAMRQVPADTKPENVKAEALAYLVENQPELPLVKRVLSAVKAALYRILGGRLVKLTPADIRSLAVAALKRTSRADAMRSTEGGLYARAAKPAVEDMLRRSAENENRTGVVVGGRPGEFGWSFAKPDAVPPPIQHPVQRGPRLEKIGPAVKQILEGSGFRKLAQEVAGITGLKVDPIEGTWQGNPEPSFSIHGKNLSEEGAGRLAKMLGFGFAQDATVVTKHAPDLAEGVPTVYVGGREVLRPEQLRQIIEAARERGLDLSTSADKKAVKFLYFGDEAGLDKFHSDIAEIAARTELDALSVMTQGDLYEAGSYLEGENTRVGGEGGHQAGTFGSPGVFGRIVDHVLVPYAKAVAAEGYRLSPDRLAERFGLSDEQRELIRSKLLPREGESRSTVPLMTGKETLDVQPTSVKGKKTVASVNDVMWALQNRAARLGQIEPGDYSPKALKAISQAIAAEVRYHVAHAEKTAIGWYDAALKAAKTEYVKIFPELKTDPDKGLLFDAVLGITSQGNDVHSNSLFAARVYQLLRDGQVTLSEAVKQLTGTFGNQTNAIELNLLKLEHLLDKNGYAHMREVFNKKMTVSEWNARLRKDEALFGPDGKPLSVEGAATQKVTGWMVFGPKIGSFINNLHGDYSTLTADLWFSRTWNRLLGYMFQHAPEREAKQYQEFKDALQAEHTQSTDAKLQNGKPVMKHGKPVPWENGRDISGLSRADFDALLNDPEKLLALARQLEDRYRVGVDFEGNKVNKGGYKIKSDLRRRAKNWIESRDEPHAAPRSDLERDFQQRTVEAAQKLIKRETGTDISVADIQAALWFHEKELFGKMGAADKRSAPADYADAAHATLEAYRQGNLYYVPRNGEFIGGEQGKYLGLTVPTEDGGKAPAQKAIDQADAEIAQAKTDSQGYDAAVACALRG